MISTTSIHSTVSSISNAMQVHAFGRFASTISPFHWTIAISCSPSYSQLHFINTHSTLSLHTPLHSSLPPLSPYHLLALLTHSHTYLLSHFTITLPLIPSIPSHTLHNIHHSPFTPPSPYSAILLYYTHTSPPHTQQLESGVRTRTASTASTRAPHISHYHSHNIQNEWRRNGEMR